MSVIKQQDFIDSIFDALQFISYYHPLDFVQAMSAAYEREASPAAKDAIAQILINSRMAAEGHRPLCQDTGIVTCFVKIGMQVQWESSLTVQEMVDEYFVAVEDMVFPMPDSLDDEMAAQLIAMPLSALMLLEFLDLQAGQWVIQNAANGAVGKSLAMLAAARGVKTINVVRSSDAIAELEAIGVKHNINTEEDNWKDQIKLIIADEKISAAVDSVGGEDSGSLLSLLGHGGTFAVFGAMSGKPMMLNPTDMIFKQATLKGFWGSKLSQEMSVENKQRLVDELIDRAVSGQLKLPTEATFDLADILKAVDGKMQSDKKGKVLLKP